LNKIKNDKTSTTNNTKKAARDAKQAKRQFKSIRVKGKNVKGGVATASEWSSAGYLGGGGNQE